MKTYQNRIIGLCLFVLFIASGCSKEKRYENRIEGEWILSNFAFNNLDVLNDFQFDDNHDYIIELEFYGDGNFDTEITELINRDDAGSSVNFTTLYGTWEISGNKLKMSHINSSDDDYTPALTYLFLDAIASNVNEYSFDEFDIIDLDKNTLSLEANVQGYEIDIIGEK